MSRSTREVPQEVMERVIYICCDTCGKEEIDDNRPVDDLRWLAVRYVAPMSSAAYGHVVGEYCSERCLKEAVNRPAAVPA